MMKAENFESKMNTRNGTDLTMTTNGRELFVEIDDQENQATIILTPDRVEELQAMLENWRRLYMRSAFR